MAATSIFGAASSNQTDASSVSLANMMSVLFAGVSSAEKDDALLQKGDAACLPGVAEGGAGAGVMEGLGRVKKET